MIMRLPYGPNRWGAQSARIERFSLTVYRLVGRWYWLRPSTMLDLSKEYTV